MRSPGKSFKDHRDNTERWLELVAMTVTLPKEVAQNILNYVPYREVPLVNWINLVEQKLSFQAAFQEFLHYFRISRRYPQYTIIFDLYEDEDYYE